MAVPADTEERIDARCGRDPACAGAVSAVLAQAADVLAPFVDEPRLEAEILLAHVLNVSRSVFRAWPDDAVDSASLRRFWRTVERRRDGVPNAYLTGRREFWSMAFEVDEAVLIPRHETECLVETALALLPGDAPSTVVDAGTGCGAVAAALAAECPHWRVIATDLSLAALAVAKRNLRRIGARNVALAAGCWLAPFRDGCIDLLVSNPPYVAAGDPHLQRGDPQFEPRIALDGGADGLDALRGLAAGARRCLKPGGYLVLEHGYDQGAATRRLLAAAGYGAIATRRDYAGQERITRARWPA
ncbi:MAG TPA: peptide chain release factor N(5)-glutamine methyltransferase [Gammaproteobacteria bacterium]